MTEQVMEGARAIKAKTSKISGWRLGIGCVLVGLSAISMTAAPFLFQSAWGIFVGLLGLIAGLAILGVTSDSLPRTFSRKKTLREVVLVADGLMIEFHHKNGTEYAPILVKTDIKQYHPRDWFWQTERKWVVSLSSIDWHKLVAAMISFESIKIGTYKYSTDEDWFWIYDESTFKIRRADWLKVVKIIEEQRVFGEIAYAEQAKIE